MTRALKVGFAVLLAAAIGGVMGGVTPALPQAGYDRPGGDYASASVPGGDPATCAARCERDKNCKSWSFSYPGGQAGAPGNAMCYLKREVVPPVASSCCVSGVRGAGVIEPQAGATEYSIDRYGGDYRSFETPSDTTGKACAEACQNENKCRAWTYRRAGYGTPTARCYLKETIKPPRRRPCCISGVVR
jgi:PAN domain